MFGRNIKTDLPPLPSNCEKIYLWGDNYLFSEYEETKPSEKKTNNFSIFVRDTPTVGCFGMVVHLLAFLVFLKIVFVVVDLLMT